MRVNLSNLKVLGAFAAMMLVAGCETASDQSGGTSSYGSGAGAGVGTSSELAQAGTQQDLAVNVGDRVQFGYNEYNLSAEARNILERQAAWLQSNSGVKVVVEGHCDERGTREYNLALGERRASSVKSYLVALGVAGNRITTISYGKERPIAFGSNEADWAKNRRGVSVVQ
ncbi:MAG: peptidoglycan-associated lipoprotein Pal [Rhodospirillales bacterium]|nr:peptidoglycan-associated lipoprotein Pal [Rhodospirillales bacterium]